jgi:DNA ligase (NAD+)
MNITKSFVKKLSLSPSKTLRELCEADVVSLIQQANHAYYNGETPLITDAVYDEIKDYMQTLDASHPILHNVGAPINKNDPKKITLPYYIPSLDKIKDDDAKVLDKWKTMHPGEYVISDKIDGVSGLLVARNGTIKLFTRGNGEVGQDISHLIPFIRGLPRIIHPKDIAVRGELVLTKDDFQHMKSQRLGADARSVVSGLVNAKLPNLEVATKVNFVAHELIHPQKKPSEGLQLLQDNGFVCVYHNHISNSDLSIKTLSDLLAKRKHNKTYEIDGLVVTHDDIHPRPLSTNPSYAFAYKSQECMQSAQTTVINVKWNVSKDGYLKPTVHFEPVMLAGVTIKKATGFNAKYIHQHNIGPGATIVICRSGDVIPHITEVIESTSPQMPEHVSYTWNKTEVDIMVSSADNEVKFKNLEYFIDKVTIKGVAGATLQKLYDGGFTNIKSIFNATVEDLEKIDGIQKKSADNIIKSVRDCRSRLDLITLMDASNCFGRGIGAKKLALILKNHNILDKPPTIDQLVAIKGIEKTTAEQYVQGLPIFWQFVTDNDLTNFVKNNSQNTSSSCKRHNESNGILRDMKVVFTGFRDDALEKIITESGGEVVQNVNKSTTLVVTKSDDAKSSKVTKAIELGIRVMNKEEFKKELGVTQ